MYAPDARSTNPPVVPAAICPVDPKGNDSLSSLGATLETVAAVKLAVMVVSEIVGIVVS